MHKFLCLAAVLTLLAAAAFSQDLKALNAGLNNELQLLPWYSASSQACQSITALLNNSVNPEVRQAFQIILDYHNYAEVLRDHAGDARYQKPALPIPEFNTALYLLCFMAQSDPLPANDLTALSIAISNSFIYTFGSRDVRQAVCDKAAAYLKFLREAETLQIQYRKYSIKDYPLEAMLAMGKLWGQHFYGPTQPQKVDTRAGNFIWGEGLSGPWSGADEEFRIENFSFIMDKPITMIRFTWCTVDIDLLYRLRAYYREQGILQEPDFHRMADDSFLYIGVSFYKYIRQWDTALSRIVRIHSQEPGSELQLNWSRNQIIDAARFVDGTDFSEWDRSLLKDPKLIEVRYRIDNAMEIAVTLFISGKKAGKENWYADTLETGLFEY